MFCKVFYDYTSTRENPIGNDNEGNVRALWELFLTHTLRYNHRNAEKKNQETKGQSQTNGYTVEKKIDQIGMKTFGCSDKGKDQRES